MVEELDERFRGGNRKRRVAAGVQFAGLADVVIKHDVPGQAGGKHPAEGLEYGSLAIAPGGIITAGRSAE